MFNLTYTIMDKKELIKIIIKVLIYALGLLGAYFGVTSLTSCTVQRRSQSSGKAVIITCDTTVINHEGSLEFKSK